MAVDTVAAERRVTWPAVTPRKSEHSTISPQRLNLTVLDPLHQRNDALGCVGASAAIIDAAELVAVQTAPKEDICELRCDSGQCRAWAPTTTLRT